MKVLFWLHKFPATSETFIRDQIIALIDQNISVSIFAKKQLKQTKALLGFEQYKLLGRLLTFDSLFPFKPFNRVQKLLKIGLSKLFWANIGIFCKALLLPKLSEKEYRFEHFFLIHYLLKTKVDVIHAHYATNAKVLARYKAIGVPMKLFVTFHGFDARIAAKDPTYFEDLIAHCNGVFSIASCNEVILKNIGFSAEQILVLPNGIDTNYFKPKAIPKQFLLPTFISVGRLAKIKGFEKLLRAIIWLREKGQLSKFKYTLVGEGTERTNLETLIQENDLENFIFLKGALSSEAVRDQLLQHQFLVVSSEAEVLPTVVLESQSCGLPVLSTPVGAVEEMIYHSGIVTRDHSIEAMAEGLLKMIQLKGQYVDMGKIGRDRIVEKYNSRNIAIQLIKYYKLHLN